MNLIFKYLKSYQSFYLPISPLLANCGFDIMKGRLSLKLFVPLMTNGRLIRDSGENQSNQTFLRIRKYDAC